MRAGIVFTMTFIALVFCPAASVADNPSPLWGNLEAGPYAAGFQTLYRFDNTRSYFRKQPSGGEYKGRPLRIMMWYPARRLEGKKPMVFSDYLSVKPGDSRFASFNAALQERDRDTARRQFSQSEPDRLFKILLETKTAAHHGLPPAQGRFPIILHSLGRNDYQMESTVLWEYLASHGYIVATVPQLPRSETARNLAFAPPDIYVQVKDIEFALGELMGLSNADSSRIALMGHSSGAIAALLAAGDNNNVRAIVSLDGSISTPDGKELLDRVKWSPDYIDIPLLNVYNSGKRDLDLGVLNALEASDLYHVAFSKATHFDFQNWPVYSVLVGVPDPRGESFRPAETGNRIFLATCKIAKDFLDATIKGESVSAPSYFKESNQKGNAPTDLAEFRFQPARQNKGN